MTSTLRRAKFKGGFDDCFGEGVGPAAFAGIRVPAGSSGGRLGARSQRDSDTGPAPTVVSSRVALSPVIIKAGAPQHTSHALPVPSPGQTEVRVPPKGVEGPREPRTAAYGPVPVPTLACSPSDVCPQP